MKVGSIIKENDTVREDLEMLEKFSIEVFSHSLQVGFVVANYVTNYEENFTDKEKEDMLIASLLHDIGKAKLPLGVLLKKEPLEKDDIKLIRSHAELSGDILKKQGFSKEIVNLATFHHYRENDKPRSYPARLPFLVSNDKKFVRDLQILSMADIFSAIVQKRAYHQPRTREEAIKEIEGEEFEIALFIKFKEMIEKTSDICLSNFDDFMKR